MDEIEQKRIHSQGLSEEVSRRMTGEVGGFLFGLDCGDISNGTGLLVPTAGEVTVFIVPGT